MRNRLLAFAILCMCMVGCGTLNNAVRVVEQGFQDIDTDATQWANVLQRVADDLPEDVQETVREEVETTAVRAVAAAEGGVQCTVDFLARRAKRALRAIRERLLGGNPPPLPPAFCLVSPVAVDLGTSPESWDTVTLHGYDMDLRDSKGAVLRFAAIDGEGRKVFEFSDGAVGRTTHYQISLNLREYVPRLHSGAAVKIVPLWSGEIADFSSGEVLVKHWTARERDDLHPPERSSYTPPHGRFGPPYNCGGDTDFDTGTMEVHVEAKLSSVTPEAVKASVFMFAKEGKPDYTCVVGTKEEVLYIPPTGWEVVSVRQQEPCKHDFNIRSHGIHARECPGGSIVRRFNIAGDQRGNDAGGYTGVEVEWRDLNIRIRERLPVWLARQQQ